MCSAAAAVAGGQGAMGMLGAYLQYQQAKQATEEANRQKDIRDAAIRDKLIFDYGQGAQRVADLNKQSQQLDDIEAQNLLQEEIAMIQADARLQVSELQEGQSTELVKNDIVRSSLNAQDAIKANTDIDQANIAYAKRDVDTGLDLARFEAVNAINSTTYQQAPNQMLYLLQGVGSGLNAVSTYYSMPESSRQSWFSSSKSPSKSSGVSSTLKNEYYNYGKGKYNSYYSDLD